MSKKEWIAVVIVALVSLSTGIFFLKKDIEKREHYKKALREGYMINMVLKDENYSRAIGMLLSPAALSKEGKDNLLNRLAEIFPELPDSQLDDIFKSALQKYPDNIALINAGWAWVLFQKEECDKAREKISESKGSQNPFVKKIEKMIGSKCGG